MMKFIGAHALMLAIATCAWVPSTQARLGEPNNNQLGAMGGMSGMDGQNPFDGIDMSNVNWTTSKSEKSATSIWTSAPLPDSNTKDGDSASTNKPFATATATAWTINPSSPQPSSKTNDATSAKEATSSPTNKPFATATATAWTIKPSGATDDSTRQVDTSAKASTKPINPSKPDATKKKESKCKGH